MSIFDWLIVIIPLAFVIYMGFYSRKMICQVSDFLSAGRCSRRYLISVAGVAEGLSIISLLGSVEVMYRSGFSMRFWGNTMMPLLIVMGLTGYCTYRFRQTKAMSFGQLLEMRYSRKLRIFAAALRSLSEMLANMIMPALAARFFIYFLGLPHHVNIFGWQMPTFNAIMVFTLSLAVLLVCLGGTLSLMITDCIQGMICYPLMVLFVIFILCNFSWSDHVIPVMMDRIPGESFINPYDVSNIRDFNVFFIGVNFFSAILHRGSWIGYGGDSSAVTPHEQKMAGLLGQFRGALNLLFYVLVSVAILVLMNHEDFAGDAKTVRDNTSCIIAGELTDDPEIRNRMVSELNALPPQQREVGTEPGVSARSNPDIQYFKTAENIISEEVEDKATGNKMLQTYRTLYLQMMTATSMRHLLPAGMAGLFCLMMVLAMLSTDDTRIFSSSLTVAQDVVMPLFKRPLTQEEHIRLLRICSIGVGIFYFLGSSFMGQLDYIQLFVTTMTIIWQGGCGPVMIFGLYSRFGTTRGAWTSLLTGLFMALTYLMINQGWTHIYQFLNNRGWADNVGNFLENCSRPMEPFIKWRMDPVKCPVNSYEFYLFTMLVTLVLYITVSLLDRKTPPFNLDRMLHRGKYNLDKNISCESAWTWKSIWGKLIGITPEFTVGDKVIAWSIFGYSIVFQFFLAFIGVIIWNIFDPWSDAVWGWYFFIVLLLTPGIIAAVVAVWFGIGIVKDFRIFLSDIKKRKINLLDNGTVEGNMSLADKAELEALDK